MTEAVAVLRDLPGDAGLDLGGVREALAVHDDPVWRVVLAGRVGSGKTSLLNAWIGERRHPVGLGGVTREVQRVLLRPDLEILDTPGIDGAAAAEVLLADAAEHADAIVWVVDGLQPCTGTERGVIDHILRPGDRLDVVVSHLDLVDEDEVPDVLERVRALVVPRGARSVTRMDLRRVESVDPDALLRRVGSGRRARAIAAAIDAVCADVVAAAPRAVKAWPWVGLVRFEWQQMVRDALAATLAAVEARDLDRHAALHRLAREARGRVEAFETWVARIEALGGARLALPRLELSATGPSVRAVRAVAGRWMGEGDAELSLWASALCPPDVRQGWRELERRVVALRGLTPAADERPVAGGPSRSSPATLA